MKLWIDDLRPAPEGYVWSQSVNRTKWLIEYYEDVVAWASTRNTAIDKETVEVYTIELIDIDHDAGDYASDGGDYIRLLDWFEETGRNYPIRIHSQNVVGRENMLRICKKNNWTILD